MRNSTLTTNMRFNYRLGLLSVFVLLLLGACNQAPAPEGVSVPEETELLETQSNKTFALRGNTSFSESNLPADARTWYRRTWAAIRHSSPATDYRSLSNSGNLYNYGRSLNNYLTSLLMTFRVTGDLRLLDEIDRHLQIMRGKLRTTWVDSKGNSITPSDGTRGLRRWLFLRGGGSLYGKDTIVMDSVMTHAMIANMAYAYEMNRGVRSPGGVNYGERADFWKTYLKNDFEQIWRIRNGSRLPYWSHQVSHSYRSNMRWNYYMWRLFGESRYRDAALQLANSMNANERDVSTTLGTARVWSHRLLDQSYGLQPMGYASYDWMILADLALDGFSPVAQSGYMRKHATTLAHFIMDNGTKDFSFDVGGMRTRAGIPSRDPWTGSSLTYGRQNPSQLASRPYAFLAAYDASGRVRSVSEGVYRSLESDQANPKRPFIPAAMVFSLMYNR